MIILGILEVYILQEEQDIVLEEMIFQLPCHFMIIKICLPEN